MINFYRVIKNNNFLILNCLEKGGYLQFLGENIVNSDTVCKGDFSSIFTTKFENQAFISLYWDDNLDNGTIYYQLDEFYNNTWNRRKGVGLATNNMVFINEIDGISTIIKQTKNRIFLERTRNSSSSGTPIQMASNNLKITTEKIRNKKLNCFNCKKIV